MRTIKRFLKFDQAGRRSEEGPIVLRPGERIASVQMLDASPEGTVIGSGACALRGCVSGGELQQFSTDATFASGTTFRAVVGHTTYGVQPYTEIDFVVTTAEAGYAAMFIVRLTEAED